MLIDAMERSSLLDTIGTSIFSNLSVAMFNASIRVLSLPSLILASYMRQGTRKLKQPWETENKWLVQPYICSSNMVFFSNTASYFSCETDSESKHMYDSTWIMNACYATTWHCKVTAGAAQVLVQIQKYLHEQKSHPACHSPRPVFVFFTLSKCNKACRPDCSGATTQWSNTRYLQIGALYPNPKSAGCNWNIKLQ